MVALSDGAGEVQWAAWLREARSRLRASDFSGITHLLAAYGGMGSFDDVIFENGAFALQPGPAQQNERLDTLRSQTWKLADEIRREHAAG